MLDARPTAYLCPIDEQEIGPLTPVIHVENLGDEDALVTGLVRIYRESLGVLIYSSVLHPTALSRGQSADMAAETEFDPGAPSAHDFFILAQVSATSVLTGRINAATLGQFFFDITPAPMGPPPETHHTTHEAGGMDPVDVDGMPGVLAEPQNAVNHALAHEPGGADPLDVTGMPGILAQPQPPAAHDIAGADHTSGATPGQILQADANGLPVDATNTDGEVADAVTKRNTRANGTTSSATPTPNADTTDLYFLSALAEAATFGAPTGTPQNGQKLLVRALDNGTARALAWNAGAGGYVARGVALPTTTVLSKYLYVGFIYNIVSSTWDCVASSQET
jgi:hypothetical protein